MELILFVGIPASGKSTMSAQYKKKGYLVLSSDAIRETITGGTALEHIPQKDHSWLHSQVFEQIRLQTVAALRSGRSVVVDATNVSRKRRISFLKQLQPFHCPKKCMLFIAPVEVCMERNRKRSGNARIPDESLYRMICNFECPCLQEGWDEIIPVVSGEAYAFPFEKTRDFRQDNPHHTLSLEGHLKAAVDFCRANQFGPMLERVAWHHDIGKLYTKRFENYKGEPTEHAHYIGHDGFSTCLYLAQSCCGKELSPEAFRQVLYEACLINCHMRPLTYWRQNSHGKQKDTELFGADFIVDLEKLHQADRAAH